MPTTPRKLPADVNQRAKKIVDLVTGKTSPPVDPSGSPTLSGGGEPGKIDGRAGVRRESQRTKTELLP